VQPCYQPVSGATSAGSSDWHNGRECHRHTESIAGGPATAQQSSPSITASRRAPSPRVDTSSHRRAAIAPASSAAASARLIAGFTRIHTAVDRAFSGFRHPTPAEVRMQLKQPAAPAPPNPPLLYLGRVSPLRANDRRMEGAEAGLRRLAGMLERLAARSQNGPISDDQ
jgi:hypothetical protein